MVINQWQDLLLMIDIFSLKNKRALVSGASRGIGYHLALGLAKAGAEVVAAARSIKGLQELQKKALQESLKIKIVALDLCDLKKVQEFITKTEPFSILINNAGTNKPEPVLEVSEENFDLVMELNIKASFFLAKEVAKKMIKYKKKGSIINISSQMGHISGSNRAVYSASKHAVEGFTKGMALEWGKFNIRVNTVCPTFIRTPMTEPMFKNKEFLKDVLNSICLGRMGKIEEVVGPVIFLASDASSLVTGSALMVDGGWTAK